MKPIKAVHFDADGVLITGGDFHSTPPELKGAIAKLRKSGGILPAPRGLAGVLFNMASGRPLFEQEELFRIITDNAEPKENEGILYEASAVKLWNSEEKHQVGGLSYEQIDQVECFLIQHGLATGMVPQQNNRKYATQYGLVTPTYRTEGVTNKKLLERKFSFLKPIIEKKFPFSQVEMSADAIDIMALGVSKDKPTEKYSKLTGIAYDETAAIGDSGGDMAMLRLIAKNGGKVGYVGENKDHVNELAAYGDALIKTNELGPLGAVEFVEGIIKYNHDLFDWDDSIGFPAGHW